MKPQIRRNAQSCPRCSFWCQRLCSTSSHIDSRRARSLCGLKLLLRRTTEGYDNVKILGTNDLRNLLNRSPKDHTWCYYSDEKTWNVIPVDWLPMHCPGQHRRQNPWNCRNGRHMKERNAHYRCSECRKSGRWFPLRSATPESLPSFSPSLTRSFRDNLPS